MECGIVRLIKEETKVGNASCTLTVHEDEQNESSLKVVKWDNAQTKTLK